MADLVRLGVFSPSVVLGVAAASGALERAGLAIEEVPATSSTQQFADLLAGQLDAVFTSPDNVLAHSGELLARQGLRAGRDYEVLAYGSTPRRAAALAAGECAMSVLNAGNDLRAEAAGCTRLSRASSLGRYIGTVLAAPGPSVEDESTPLRALTAVVLATCRALAAGRLRELATDVTATRLGLGLDGVRRYLETLSDPREGLVPDGRVDTGSLETLRWLRSRYGDGGPALAALVEPGSGLVDERFLAESTA